MKKVLNSKKYGEILYYESFWSGRNKKITVNGTIMNKVNNNSFVLSIEEEKIEATVTGNVFKGVVLHIGDEFHILLSETKWYEYILGCLSFLLVLIWGNSKDLCNIVPIVGGALGGAVSAMASFLAIIFMKSTKNILVKILIALATLAVVFAVCAGLGYAFLSIAS